MSFLSNIISPVSNLFSGGGGLGGLGGVASGGLTGLLGGMGGGLLGGMGGSQAGNSAGNLATTNPALNNTYDTTDPQYGSLMDMLARYQQPAVGQTGQMNLNNQGLV